jgi:hypothetical protein
MCWSADASLKTFMIGIIGILYGYVNNYSIIELIFLFSFSIMQLIEYFIWTYYNNPYLNHIFTLIGYIIIGIQPIISILTLKDKYVNIMIILLVIYISGILIKKDKIINQSYYSYEGKNKHLVWSWLEKKNMDYISLFIYFICLLLPILINGYIRLFFYGLITLILSLYYFIKYDTWGTIWCWLVNFWVLFMVISDLYMKRVL